MRKFTGGVVLDKLENGTLRLILTNPTGEQVCKDLTPAEAEAIRETLTAEQPAKRRKGGKET
jgi:hypothetical protein